MLKSSLLEIVRTFSKQEMIKFEDFVRSPYFNKKENVLKLFLEIKNYAPEFTDENLEKEKIWKKLFPVMAYNYGILKNLIFDLNKLAEQFIIDLYFSKEEFKRNEFLISELLNRGLKKNYLSKDSALNKELNLFPANSGNVVIDDYLSLMSKIYDRKMFYAHMFEHNTTESSLQIGRDSYHISKILILLFGGFSDVEVYSHVRNAEVETNPVTIYLDVISTGLEKIINSLNNTSTQNQIYVRINYLMYLAIRQKTEESYLNFKKMFFENTHLFPTRDMHDMHYCLITAAVKSEHRNLNLNREIVEILDSMSEYNVIIERETGKIPVYIFHYYISNSFLLLDSGKIEAFRNKYIDKIEAEHLTNTKNYVDFMLSFIKKDFNEALNFLSLLDINHLGMKIPMRYQKAMCSYETDNYEMFLNENDSLKHFLKNNKFISEDQRSLLSNYFNCTNKLFKLKNNFTEIEFDNLRKDIFEAFRNTNVWFNQKLDELENANLK